MSQPRQPSQGLQQPLPAKPASFTLSESLQRRILWIFFALWVVLVIVGITYHEQWRDEGSDWTTVRHVSIPEMLRMIPQIGHPPLWYVLMYPLGNMSLPLVTVNIVSSVVMGIAMYFMLFKLRFPFYLKLALVFSMFFVYEYPVVGRNYCLVVLFLMLTLWYYPKRFEKPLVYALIIVCLYNTHSMVFPMAFAMMLLYFWEMVEQKRVNGQTITAAILMIIGGGYLIPYMALPGIKAVTNKMIIPDHFAELQKVTTNGLMVGGGLDGLAMLAFILLIILLLPRLKPFAVLLCGAGGLLYLLTFKYVGQHRHHGLLMVEFLFVYGLAGFYAQDKMNLAGLAKYNTWRIGTMVLAGVLVIQSYFGVNTVLDEIDRPFSDGKSAAEYLKENNLEHKILVGHQSWAASSVLQQLPADCKMYWADTRRWGYFIRFDSLYLANQFRYPAGDFAAVTAEHVFRDSISQVVLVLNSPIQTPQIASLWTEKYKGGIWAGEDQKPVKSQESFVIYVRNPQYPAAVNMPPVDSIFKAE